MERSISSFKIGDQVALKLNPEFKGIITQFYIFVNNFGKRGDVSGPVDLTNTQIYATVTTLNESFVEITKEVRVIHLKLVERY